MYKYQTILITSCLVLVFGFLLGACRRVESTPTETQVNSPTSTKTPLPSSSPTQTPTASQTIVAYPAPSEVVFVTITPGAYPQPGTPAFATPTQFAYPAPLTQAASPAAGVSSPTTNPSIFVTVTPNQTQTALASASPPLVSPTRTATKTAVPQYPGPGVNPTVTSHYPGPVITNTSIPYPGPSTPTSGPTRTASRSLTPAPTAIGTGTAFPAPTARTGTPGVVPTELPPKPPLSPPPPGSSVTIWYSWGSTETAALQSIIQSFQHIYPDVTFSLRYVPLDDLHDTYQEASYNGSGPDILLGPASWGPGYYDEELIADLTPYVPPDFLSGINPAALESGKYQHALISLPLSQHGMVMFRNVSIIKTAPLTFDDLKTASSTATHSGIVGSYLERGATFSSADILGLGGSLMDEFGYPTFNNQFGLEWFDLLTAYDIAGAVTFNTNWDLEMFKRDRVGIIIDGTWNTSLLIQIIGAENLAIDPWPTYGTGHMSGWVEADSVYLNTNSTGDDRSAALAFMGYLLDPNVQVRLAEVGHIPSVSAAVPRDPLIQQAMRAFSYGSAYPLSIDQSVLDLYQTELDKAIQNVFVNGASASEALKLASDTITNQLESTQTPH